MKDTRCGTMISYTTQASNPKYKFSMLCQSLSPSLPSFTALPLPSSNPTLLKKEKKACWNGKVIDFH